MRWALLLVTGCWSTSPQVPIAPEPPANTFIVDGVSSSPARKRPPLSPDLPRHSVWEGTYVCNQGLSAVTLTIDLDRAGNATARYDFGPVPSNPSVPTGAYLLTGELHRQDGGGFAGELVDSEWITRPPNYFMVPVAIETSDGKTMKGTIRHPSCREFQATRIQ